MKIAIRPATEDDLTWLLSELKKFSQFIQLKHSVYGEEEYIKNGLLGVIKNNVLLLAESDTDRLGFIGGIFTPHLFNPKLNTLVEIFWWVSEQFRNTRAGLMLLNAFIEHGKKTADLVTMSLEFCSPVNEKTLTKRGFHLHEKSYLMEV